VTRIDVIRAALASIRGSTYLEIGVRDGDCFDEVVARTKVGVDPAFRFRIPARARLRRLLSATAGSFYYPITSDAFFGGPARRFAPYDVVFVDGLHTYAQSYADVLNALAVLSEGGVVLVHDCNPGREAAAAPTLDSAARTPGFNGEWNGDVYKTLIRLRTHPDLRACVLDCDQGVGIVRRGSPEARLDLSPDEVEQLDYRALDDDRARLLDLRPPEHLSEILGSPG
jgi:Methyltransferase domain